MKRKILLLFVTMMVTVFCARAQVVLNDTNFPDANFRAALASELGINEGDEITAEKIASTTYLNFSDKSIADLTGIEYFTALKYLHCYNNQLTALDVSNNTALTRLDCYNNKLTALDVSKNTALTTLRCNYNQLTDLDVSNNTALTYLSCLGNQLTALDLSNNTALYNLNCQANQLTTLNVSNNTALTNMTCFYNQLTSLDVSNNTALTKLWCDNNQLTSLDVSKNTVLTDLSCSNNQLTILDVSNNTALTELHCRSNQLTALDVSKNTALTWLYCDNNRIQGTNMDSFIQSLPVSGGSLYLINSDDFEEGNEISNTQITNAQGKGWDIYYWENNEWNKVPTGGGRDIDINDLLGDYTFYYGSSGTTTMDCQLVKTSSGYGLKFTGTPEGIIPVTMSFDNSTIGFKNTQFVGDWKTASVTTDQAIVLLMYTNGTTVYRSRSTTSVGLKGTLSIDPETADVVWTMTGIAPSGYDFYALRVANTSDGTYETITSTNISSWLNPVKLVKKKKEIVLNAENFPDANFRAALATKLGINEGDEITANMIASTTSLDVSYKSIANLTGIEYFTALTWLSCVNNQLTALDISNNTALTTLWCNINQLTALDVSNNTALDTLACGENPLTTLDVSNNTALTALSCSGNQLTTLDVSNNTALKFLECPYNQLSALDVSNNTALTTLYCNNNQLTALDVSKNTALTYLHCYNNPLTALNVSNNTALTTLYCNNNQLTALDVSNNTALTDLSCRSNQLTTLNVSNNTALTRLYCDNNRIQGTNMDSFIQSLPVSGGSLHLINSDDFEEGNEISNTQITNAQGKGWDIYYWENNEWNKVPTGGGRDIDINDLLGDYTFYYGSSGTTTMDCQLVKTSSGYGLKFTGTPEGIIPVNMSFDNSTMKFMNTQFVGDWKTASVTTDQAIVLLMYTNGTSVYRTASTTSVGLKGTLSIDPETNDTIWTMTGTAPSGRDFYALRVANTSEGTYETITSTNISSWLNPVKLVKEKKVVVTVLNEENFPDANFRAALATRLGISEGETITQEKINATTSLDVSDKNISNLKGIEHFTALTYLYCDYNQLTTLDVSKNTTLTNLDCSGNQLTALDVSKNTELTSLECYNNQLTALDVSKNTALTELECYNNQLTALDVSKNTALTYLYCSENQLTALDVSKNTALTELECEYNQLTALDVSKNTALTLLECDYNQLTTLDVSKNTTLTNLDCSNNQLTALDVSKNTALTYLSCTDNQLTTLDVSKNTTLTNLDCSNNQLTALDVSKNTALTSLECVYNQLTTLDVSKNTALTSLYCYNNQLTALDVSKNTALTYLCCYNNQIKGAKMDALVTSLPTVTSGLFYVIDTQDENEGNVCTNTQVNAAKAKGWTVYDNNGNNEVEYEGSDELILNEDNFTDSNFRSTLSQILGISEDDEITPEMIDEITTLNVSNKTISNLKGIEHFKELMVLYCQLNQIKGADMDDLIASLPTIDTSSAAPALNAPRKTSGTWGALYAYDNTAGNEGNVITTEQVADANAKSWKVYQFNGTAWEEYAGSTTGITIVENNGDATTNWYTLDGKRLYGEPVTKGVYIVEMSNGLKKKVMVK